MVSQLTTISGSVEPTILGHNGKLKWNTAPGGLTVDLPEKNPGQFAYAFKIEM